MTNGSFCRNRHLYLSITASLLGGGHFNWPCDSASIISAFAFTFDVLCYCAKQAVRIETAAKSTFITVGHESSNWDSPLNISFCSCFFVVGVVSLPREVLFCTPPSSSPFISQLHTHETRAFFCLFQCFRKTFLLSMIGRLEEDKQKGMAQFSKEEGQVRRVYLCRPVLEY